MRKIAVGLVVGLGVGSWLGLWLGRRQKVEIKIKG